MKHLWLFGLLLLPFSLFAQSVTDFDVGVLEITPLGSGNEIHMGRTAEIGRFRLTNRSRKSLLVRQINFRNYGSANMDESFQDLSLYVAGERVSSDAYTDRRNITFVLPEFWIFQGDSAIFSIEGQLIYAKNGKTVQLGIRYKEDIQAEIANTGGFSVRCENCRGTRLKSYELRPGGIYLRSNNYRPAYRYYNSRRRSTAPRYSNYRVSNYTNRRPRINYYRPPSGNQTYNAGSKGVTFFSSYFNAKTGFEVEGIFLEVASGSQVTDKNGNGVTNEAEDFSEVFSDFKLYLNGQLLDSTNDFEVYNGRLGLFFNATTQIWPNTQLLLQGRIKNNGVNGDKVKFRLNGNGLIDPVYLHSYQTVPSQNINGSRTGNFSDVGGSLNIYKR